MIKFDDEVLDRIHDLGPKEATLDFAYTIAEYRDKMSDMGLKDNAIEAAELYEEIMAIFERRTKVIGT